VFLARLLIVYGTDAPDLLRNMADELEELAEELGAEESRSEPGAARPTRG
jgi:hypothetical protein